MSANETARGVIPEPSRRAATSTQQDHSPTDGPEPALFGVEVSTHPDFGARVAWTVATPDELRDQGLAQVERRASAWERDAIDKVIADVIGIAVKNNVSFTANDCRPRLPEGVNRALIGARFTAAARAGRIRRIGYERSTDPRTHSAVVAVWRPA